MADIKAALGKSFAKMLGKSPEEQPQSVKSITKEKPSAVSDGDAYLKIISKNFLSLHLMARDINVARQNTDKLVKLEGGDPAKGADAHWLKEGEKETKLGVEVDKLKPKTPEPVAKPQKKKGILGKIADKFNFTKIIKSFTKYFYIIGAIALIWDLFKDTFTE